MDLSLTGNVDSCNVCEFSLLNENNGDKQKMTEQNRLNLNQKKKKTIESRYNNHNHRSVCVSQPRPPPLRGVAQQRTRVCFGFGVCVCGCKMPGSTVYFILVRFCCSVNALLFSMFRRIPFGELDFQLIRNLIGFFFCGGGGGGSYSLFMLSFLWPSTWLLYVASAVLGVGAALIWTGQGTYLSRCSNQQTISRNSGVFWAILQTR